MPPIAEPEVVEKKTTFTDPFDDVAKWVRGNVYQVLNAFDIARCHSHPDDEKHSPHLWNLGPNKTPRLCRGNAVNAE